MGKQSEQGGVPGNSFSTARDWLNRPWRVELTCENLAWLAVAVGVAMRIWEYLEFRELYIDETALLKNIIGRRILDFSHVLEEDQMAPPAFLAIERMLVHLPMTARDAARLFPLFCGILSVFLMRSTARRYVDRRAVPIAVGLLALGDHLIYYSSEIKQYSCDLIFAQLALLLAVPRTSSAIGSRRLLALALFGLAAPWFAFPTIFLLAGIGLHLVVIEARRKDWRRVGLTVVMGLAWMVSFVGCFLLSKSIMSKRDFLWVWWNFAFLPLPPRSSADVSLLIESLANVFINPASILGPLSFPYTAGLASVLALIGCVSLGRRWPGGLFLLISPLVLALAASGLHQYPFHGRLLLYLVPTYLLLLAEGIAAAGRPTGWIVTLALAAFFLYGEAAEIVWQKAIVHRFRTFDTHGDLKNDLLDYLEYERMPKPLRRRRDAQRQNPVQVPTPREDRNEPSR
jgi:hypothetical protein